MKKLFVLAAFTAIIVLSGCTAAPRKIDPADWTFIEAVIGEPQTLDPAAAYDTASGSILEQVYETLLYYEYGDPATLIPKLAASMPTWTVDGMQCTITLRQGVTFHDGTPFNATAVKTSFDRIILLSDPGGPGWMFADFLLGAADYAYMNFTAATAQEIEDAGMIYQWGPDGDEGTDDDDEAAVYISGDYEVIITLGQPYVAFNAVMAYTIGSIISPTFIAANAATEIWGEGENSYVVDHAIGTGPYKLVEWERTVQVELELNEDYYNMPTTTPPTKYIQKLIPEVSTRVQQLEAGKIDACDISTSDMDLVWQWTGTDPLTGSEKDPDMINVEIGFETWGIANFAFNQRLAPFDNHDFRAALAYSFPYEDYIATTINGMGKPLKGVIPAGMFGYNQEYNFEEDDELALEYFENSTLLEGKTAADPLAITITYNQGNTNRKAACEILKEKVEDLTDGLLEITVQEMAWAQMLDALDAFELGAWLIGWGPDYADPDDYIQPYYGGTGSNVQGYYARRTGWNNTDINDRIIQARSADDATRITLYEEIEQLAMADVPYIHLYEGIGFQLMGAWVKNWKSNPMVSGYYLLNIWADTAHDMVEVSE